jgi:hypothetical protein
MPARSVPSRPGRHSNFRHIHVHAVPMLGVACSMVRSAAMRRLLNLRYGYRLRRQIVSDFTRTVRAAPEIHDKGKQADASRSAEQE